MPIWFELAAMMLAAYAMGLLLGWLIWGRAPLEAQSEEDE